MADFTKRFGRKDDTGTNAGGRGGSVAVGEQGAPPPVQGETAGQRARDHAHGDHDHDGVRDRDERRGGVATRDRAATAGTAAGTAASARDVRARQRDEFGGFNWGSAFFGWLVAVGLGALLTAILAAAGTAIGLTSVGESDARANAETIGLGGGILLLLVAMIAYYAGGYVAGRMSRFDGARQGFGVWIFGLIVTVAIAAAGWILGDEYNVLDQLNLPRIPADAGDLTTGGLIALGAILLGTLLAAIFGGKVGQRYHNKVDRHGFGERV
jgi:amino acid transporter